MNQKIILKYKKFLPTGIKYQFMTTVHCEESHFLSKGLK